MMTGCDIKIADVVLTGGYQGPLQCGVFNLTRVLSISYGEAEADLPENYQKRQCSEWMKLSLQVSS